jgi:transposase
MGLLNANPSLALQKTWRFAEHGHTVRLIAPQYVKPDVKGNKNDKADAAAIAEAAMRPSMRFVPVKSSEALALQTIHRVRERLVGQRTALVNETRVILFEQGIGLTQGVPTPATFVAALIHAETKETVTPMCKETIVDFAAELAELAERIAVTDRRLERFAEGSDAVKRLQTIPGIGLITATALVAAVADPRAFKNGRQFAAWLGLLPRHSGTGGADKNKLGGILRCARRRGDSHHDSHDFHEKLANLTELTGPAA